METFKSVSVVIALILGGYFIIFLVWIIVMVHQLKGIPNHKIEALGDFFNKLPIKKFFSLFSNNNLNKNDK
ncbi:hypothetical protein [Winogradskyella marincola]|uniref:Uncharacterized protein n=1 Tax=Winogradskyella marincola TaxID=3037795 RepID=A0ABT6FZU3_9FLAO|nr:hypothetical protein [Winogradskyella sp. YYF002]MDG4715291.1 hypothetical protein [Winogradskyella sp. YYF002]